jgi:hypothetical protein
MVIINITPITAIDNNAITKITPPVYGDPLMNDEKYANVTLKVIPFQPMLSMVNVW